MANIVVAEDNTGTLAWLSELLEDAGHQVWAAQDGLQGQSLTKRHQIDLVITDVSMPNEDGLGLIRALRKTSVTIKIIAITGKNYDHLRDALLLGANSVLCKPLTAITLLTSVTDLLKSNLK